jgi:hypothetical protein
MTNQYENKEKPGGTDSEVVPKWDCPRMGHGNGNGIGEDFVGVEWWGSSILGIAWIVTGMGYGCLFVDEPILRERVPVWHLT